MTPSWEPRGGRSWLGAYECVLTLSLLTTMVNKTHTCQWEEHDVVPTGQILLQQAVLHRSHTGVAGIIHLILNYIV